VKQPAMGVTRDGIAYQDISMQRTALRHDGIAQPTEIGQSVCVVEEEDAAVVAPLGDVMGLAGGEQASDRLWSDSGFGVSVADGNRLWLLFFSKKRNQKHIADCYISQIAIM
jgi:hypothetical protein